MSQPDLLTQLRETRPIAPEELRERIRRIAAEAEQPAARRLTWRRAFVVVAPLAAVIAAAVVIPSEHVQIAQPPEGTLATLSPAQPTRHAFDGAVAAAKAAKSRTESTQAQSTGAATDAAAPPSLKRSAPVPTPSGRTQRYIASLELRLRNAKAISEATKRAVKIAESLGGYPLRLNVNTGDGKGYADLKLRIPRQRVPEAVNRLSALGTIVGENVSIQDLQGQVDSTGRLIKRLQAKLASWRALPQTETTLKHIDALTAQIQRLQVGRASTIRTASFATVNLELATPRVAAPAQDGHGPLHKLGGIFRWAGIGAVYGLALGTPLILVVALGWLLTRSARRRREEKLLSRS